MASVEIEAIQIVTRPLRLAGAPESIADTAGILIGEVPGGAAAGHRGEDSEGGSEREEDFSFSFSCSCFCCSVSESFSAVAPRPAASSR